MPHEPSCSLVEGGLFGQRAYLLWGATCRLALRTWDGAYKQNADNSDRKAPECTDGESITSSRRVRHAAPLCRQMFPVIF